MSRNAAHALLPVTLRPLATLPRARGVFFCPGAGQPSLASALASALLATSVFMSTPWATSS